MISLEKTGRGDAFCESQGAILGISSIAPSVEQKISALKGDDQKIVSRNRRAIVEHALLTYQPKNRAPDLHIIAHEPADLLVRIHGQIPR
jgi:hypothetical protein